MRPWLAAPKHSSAPFARTWPWALIQDGSLGTCALAVPVIVLSLLHTPYSMLLVNRNNHEDVATTPVCSVCLS